MPKKQKTEPNTAALYQKRAASNKRKQTKEAYLLPFDTRCEGYRCELRRSPNRRTLGLRVTKAREIVIYAPTQASDERIRAFLLQHAEWLRHATAVTEEKRSNYPEPTQKELAALRQEAKERLPERIAYYARLTGLTPTGFRVSSAKTRFGSCNAKRSLSFSCLLMRYPEAAIDYVVLHEICHIAHMNHSAAFYKLLHRYMPDYKEREKLLRL